MIFLIGSQALAGQPYAAAVKAMDLEEVAALLSSAKVAALLGGQGVALPDGEKRAAAVLVSTGVLNARDLADPALVKHKISRFEANRVTPHADLRGRLGDDALITRLVPEGDYEVLLEARELLDDLGELLADGIITGYDLRQREVYADTPQAHGLVYSHSSWRHLRQLAVLLRSEDVAGWMYVTPKVSAFLYREEWGTAGPHVVTLGDGTRVVQAREMATLFEFDSPAQRRRFHEIVQRYAKKDADDEPGLIADSWWQPFYYSRTPINVFKRINLVIVTAGEHEATLTVLTDKTANLLTALENYPWPVRVDEVWVNPAFERFLQGGYK